MSADHTPTPWYVSGGKTIRYGVKGAGGDGWIGKANWRNGEANAAFIVRAVNAHDDLVAALRPFADAHFYYSDADKPDDLPTSIGGVTYGDFRRAVSVLAKAEE